MISVRQFIRKDYKVIGPYEGISTIRNYLPAEIALEVVEGETHIGFFTSKDLLYKSHNLVIDCIAPKSAINPDTRVSVALQMMRKEQTEIIPVYEGDHFIGGVHKDDLVEYVYKMLEEQKDVVHAVAHDLKTPIANITGLTHLLKGNLTKHENIELLSYAEDSCNYATQIITNLLFENNHDKKDLIEINAFLKECLTSMVGIATVKNIEIRNEIADEEAYQYVHKLNLQRAIQNIISNALKFTPAGGHVHMNSSVRNGVVTIYIKDNGIGIAEDIQPIIFNKFTKAKRNGVNGESSTGLGMHITKMIIEAHHGKIWFDSSLGAGTVFYVELPL